MPWSACHRRAVFRLFAGEQLRAPRTIERITNSGRTESGRARELRLAGAGERVRISATTFRFAVGRVLGWNTLPGDRYEVTGLVFRGTGAGHGVGLCQRGADEMGAEGRSYREILAFYYPGTVVGMTGSGISWTRLGGEDHTLFTTHPDRDGAVPMRAESQLRDLARRTNLPALGAIEIRLYPGVETFRNATGEPATLVRRVRFRGRMGCMTMQVIRAKRRGEIVRPAARRGARKARRRAPVRDRGGHIPSGEPRQSPRPRVPR